MTNVIPRLLLLFLIFSQALAQTISVSQSVDRSNIAFEDSVRFEVTLQWDGPQTAYIFDRPLNLAVTGMKIRGFASSVSTSPTEAKEITTKKYVFTLEPVMPGLATINPVSISYVSWPDSLPGQLVTEAATVTIAEPIPEEPTRQYAWMIWLIIPVAVIAVAVVFILLRRDRSRDAGPPVKSPGELFLDQLQAVRDEAGSDLKKFQTGLNKILLDFLRSEYNLDAADVPDGELTDRLFAAGVTEPGATRISEWLQRARKDKFSPVASAPGETVRLEAEIRQFFEKW